MVHVEGKPTREVPNQRPKDAKRVGVATVTAETIQYNAALEGGLGPQGRTNKEDLRERERGMKGIESHSKNTYQFLLELSSTKIKRGETDPQLSRINLAL